MAGHVILGHDLGHSFLACCFLAGLLFPAKTAEEESKHIAKTEKNTFFILSKFDMIKYCLLRLAVVKSRWVPPIGGFV